MKKVYWLPEVGILWLFFASRLWNVLHLPAFLDEGWTVIRARNIARGIDVFEGLMGHGKWLQPATMALFSVEGPETLWLVRATTAVLVTVSCAACIALGRMLASRTTGLLAGLFTILPTLGLINERLAWSDNWMAAFSAIAMALGVRLAQTARARYVLPLGLAMAAAVLSKISAVPLLPMPIVAVLILPREPGRQRMGLALLSIGVAVVLLAGVVGLAIGNSPTDPAPEALQTIPGIENICLWSTLCEETGEGLVAGLLANLTSASIYGRWMWMLVGPPMLALILVTLARLRSEHGRAIAFLWIVLLGRSLPLFVVGGFLPTRNWQFVIVPMAVLAALGAVGLWSMVWRTSQAARPIVQRGYSAFVALVVTAGLLWSGPMDLTFLSKPEDLAVPQLFTFNCQRVESAAYGYDAVALTLRDWERANRARANLVVENDHHMQSYWGPRTGDIEKWQGSDSLRVRMALWVMAGETIFFVDRLPPRPLPDVPFGATLETVAEYPMDCTDMTMRLRRLVDAGPELRNSIYEVVFPNPNESAEEYRAIALHLIESEAEGAVVVYPPHQLGLLENRLQWGTQLDGVFAVGDMWPLEASEVEAELATLAAEHEQLHVVLLEEELGDPTQVIKTWLNTNMQLASETWFGPVRLLSYESRP